MSTISRRSTTGSRRTRSSPIERLQRQFLQPPPRSSTAQAANTSASQQLAGNFDTFLQLLTTQLQNQNPLDPLDTNQFTQQLVAFAGVEQQINMNTNLQTLISMQQTSEATSALQLVGSNGHGRRQFRDAIQRDQHLGHLEPDAPTPATANLTITSAAGTTVFTKTMALNAGAQNFSWNGLGNNGQTWPDGTYKLSVSATGANGQPVNGVDPGPRHRQRRQPQFESADAHRRRTERPNQPDHIDQPLIIGVAPERPSCCVANRNMPRLAAKSQQSTLALSQILSRGA